MMTIKIPAFLFLVETDHLIRKFVWKAKGPRTIRITLKKKNKVRLTNWFQYYKAIVIKRTLLLFSHPVVSHSLWPRGLQHARPPCPWTSPEVCPSSYPLYWWCHPAISSSNALFSFCPQSFPASGTFPMSQRFTWDDQNTRHTTSIKTDKQRYWTK